MSFLETNLLSNVTADAIQTTRILDTTKVSAGSISFTCAGATSPSLALLIEGSNAVPPNGALPNQPTSGAWGSPPWSPPATSWATVASDTLAANGTKIVPLPAATLLTRWLRAKVTPDGAANGGTISVDAFLRDVGGH